MMCWLTAFDERRFVASWPAAKITDSGFVHELLKSSVLRVTSASRF
jgi:hypothetical protein